MRVLAPIASSRSRINPTSPSTLERVNYWGASLPAFVKLGRKKGYRLVGVESMCRNAFFVRDGMGQEFLPEIPATACFGHPRLAQLPTEPAHGRAWVEV